MTRIIAGIFILVLAAVAAATQYFRSGHTRLTLTPGAPQASGALPPAPHHVVVIIEENKDFDDIIGSRKAPYINELVKRSAVFTKFFGVAHPSQPNYMALFSGRTNTDGDSCKVSGIDPSAPSLGGELLASKRTFVGYAEDLPSVGFPGCYSGQYARKHAPWTHFKDVPPGDSRPFKAFTDFTQLPTLSFIIPNLLNDMHSASIQRGDAWLRTNIDPLVRWGEKNDTLIVLTWDESDAPITNHIPTIFIGPMVRAGRYDVPINHYNVLRTIENFYGLTPLGASASALPITGVWK